MWIILLSLGKFMKHVYFFQQNIDSERKSKRCLFGQHFSMIVWKKRSLKFLLSFRTLFWCPKICFSALQDWYLYIRASLSGSCSLWPITFIVKTGETNMFLILLNSFSSNGQPKVTSLKEVSTLQHSTSARVDTFF